ncbi:hypothetical protein KP79_PYT07362 [Mizuhopecten yessoensis]|uniref:G-protein coupled receptors family 1 profile domain-containing protein n=1 Tax=Mizuhopecten yessoensis TaxID=6573 RepID=A0A210QHP2_MIZYE|nr:hypothetical protein KP79_PYT07362 [Mizuhopecten yessoensis]
MMADNVTTTTLDTASSGAITLFGIALFCTIGNLGAMTMIIFNPRYRKTSMAILCHHCFLDLLKSLYCFPYAYSLWTSIEIPYCSFIGSSYVFIMTTSAYNMLALVVNEEYELSLADDKNKKGDRPCIFFGILIIWFMSLLLNLGVAIIPSNTTFIKETGNCMFLYGVPNGFVLHLLWITLVSMAIILALTSFFQIYRRITVLTKEARWSYIHRSLSGDFESEAQEEPAVNYQQFKNEKYRKSHLQFHLRRVLMYISMVTSFALFWYPLFFLTVFDPGFNESRKMYRILTITAWSQPVSTPIFCGMILRDVRRRDSMIRELSSSSFPMRLRESSRRNGPTNIDELETFDLGISNADFDQSGRTPEHEKVTASSHVSPESIPGESGCQPSASFSPARSDTGRTYRMSQV